MVTAIFAGQIEKEIHNFKGRKYLNAFDASNGLPNYPKNTGVVGIFSLIFLFFMVSKGAKLYA